MAKLTDVRDTPEIANGAKVIAVPVKGGTTIYQGALVALDASGYAIPGKKAESLTAVGRAEETVTNTGADGELVIRVARGVFVFDNTATSANKITAAHVLKPCYSKKRKKAQKTQGFVTVSRTDMTGEAVKIPKGHVFKSILDINGEELRFFVLEAATLQKGASSVDVLVEAETEGSRYNVPAGQIVRTLTYLGDVTFSNAEDWIVREGSDTEDDESARARTLRSWSELAQRATEDTFIDAAESVPGVLFAQADCNHPRGQGTVDVIVTGTAGEATEGLLAAVREAVDKIAGPYDNILVKSSVTVSQNISVTVTTDTADTDEAVENRVKAILTELLAVRRSRKLNELTLSDINHAIRSGYSGATNAAVSEPEADVKLGKDKVITLGDVSVTVERE